jgi:hypothetical protein
LIIGKAPILPRRLLKSANEKPGADVKAEAYHFSAVSMPYTSRNGGTGRKIRHYSITSSPEKKIWIFYLLKYGKNEK